MKCVVPIAIFPEPLSTSFETRSSENVAPPMIKMINNGGVRSFPRLSNRLYDNGGFEAEELAIVGDAGGEGLAVPEELGRFHTSLVSIFRRDLTGKRS